MILAAQAIGASAIKIINNTTELKVHSRFNKGFNVVDKDDNLIFIGTTENGMFPFGVVVDAYTRDQLLASVSVGQTLKVRPTALAFDRHLQLSLNAEVYKGSQNFEQADVNALKSNIQAFDFSEYADGDFDKAKILSVYEALSNPHGDAKSELTYLIGRGQGLTPSGDDILVGLLFIHFIQPFITKAHMAQIEQLVSQPLTTLVSQTFLSYAIQGIFSSRLTDLMEDASQSTLKQLLQVGSSSGKDTLYGMYTALLKE
ncbi:DUF2877 domain-containing protein [Staphylococcus sp. IVB6181]|uniref:DUF2877 domain-containing protein n=1 Tax=Staphylococcus sp. IVB6181 TaxID=2929481 RepID=UPI0021CE1F68|nr:DUF2877 domain-containing protein [Staphylococcus sp. IVB6181]UXV35366.1 DUF2877 domain-containing protein [Staphylococcus sp. IVB6181]